MLKIIKYPDPILRHRTKTIGDFDADLKKLTDDMAKTMYAHDGIGLAAPQVNILKKIIVIGHKDGQSYTAYINPEITFVSRDKTTTDEGCLSLPGIYGLVTRPKKIRIKYQDLDGKTQKAKIKGMEAIVIQHEIDHLNGILFIDKTAKITKGQDILDKLKKWTPLENHNFFSGKNNH